MCGRPVWFASEILKQQSDGAFSIHLSTQIDRHIFGASGYPDMVGDAVSIQIIAQINRLH